MKAFKAYDIRGIYGKDFTKNDVYKIGRFLPSLLETKSILIGYDARLSTPEIYNALTEGITDAGADIYDIGYSTTPMVYFATAHYGFSASVQITASHNPKQYNGLKLSRKNALPVGYETGLKELEQRMGKEPLPLKAEEKGTIHKHKVKETYIAFLSSYVTDISNLNITLDCSNGMAALLVKEIFGNTPFYLYDTLDGTFPNHAPNPLEEENVKDLEYEVKKRGSDIGVIFDGDADRVMFVDETGKFISPDLITALLAKKLLKKEKATVLHDIRTSRAVSEYIRKLGGSPFMWKVGHSYAKQKLRELDGLFGGELAGHYYFRDFYYCDSGMLACILVLDTVAELKRERKSISEWLKEIQPYAFSGEMNFTVKRKSEAMEELNNYFTTQFTPMAAYDFDGYRIEFTDWWFNVRSSNTEPYLRLVVEAESGKLLNQKVKLLQSIIKRFV